MRSTPKLVLDNMYGLEMEMTPKPPIIIKHHCAPVPNQDAQGPGHHHKKP